MDTAARMNELTSARTFMREVFAWVLSKSSLKTVEHAASQIAIGIADGAAFFFLLRYDLSVCTR
jgi:hypothetical protein